MRLRASQAIALFAVAAVLGWRFTTAAWPAAFATDRPAAGQSSPVFTPAHRTARDAIDDFFGWRTIPVQPIAYPHWVHLANGMECTQCHDGVDTGPDAQLPSVKVCMMCHKAVATGKPEIKKLAAYYGRGEDIPWQRVYDYPHEDHVRFNHAPHIRAGVDCKVCHGDMSTQTVAVRAVNLNMGFCVNCHKTKKASIECNTCHF
jgi:hypothetical protein